MPLVVSTGTVAQSEDDTGYDVRFGNFRNVQWDPAHGVMQWGTQVTKSGTTHWLGSTMRFANVTPTIPPRSTITSAVLKGTAANTQAGALTTIIEVLAQDGLWDATPEVPDQWRNIDSGNNPGDLRVTVKDSGATTLTTSHIGTGNNFLWELRRYASPARYERLGQSMEIETAGTLDTIDVILAKNGVPTGNIWLEIYDQDGNGFPDTLLATSDLFDVSTLTAGLGTVETFVFSVGNQYAFSLAEKFVAVITGDYTIDGTNYAEVQYKMPNGVQGGYTLGNAMTWGNGVGLDDQNYATNVEVIVLPSAHPSVFVFWTTPPFTVSVEYTTPDLKEIVQAYVNTVDYNEGDPFAIQLSRLSAAQEAIRNFKGFDHADTPGVSNQITLEIEWRERAIVVDA